jgi:mRNA interferase MazF
MHVNEGTAPGIGDIVMLSFGLPTGSERRAAVILSRSAYNRKTGWALALPVVADSTGDPFEVQVPEGAVVRGYVLADHVRRIDWRSRQALRIGALDTTTLAGVLGRLHALLGTQL